MFCSSFIVFSHIAAQGMLFTPKMDIRGREMECPLRAIAAVCQDWTHTAQQTTSLIDELHPMLEVVVVWQPLLLEINAAAKSHINLVSFSLNRVICRRVGTAEAKGR
jgi:hypothetical protein